MSYCKSSLYTKTGDFGTSSLLGGVRRPKFDHTFHLLGSIDELNSSLGVCAEFSLKKKNKLDLFLRSIQSNLMDLSSFVAASVLNGKESSKSLEQIVDKETGDKWTNELEAWIDFLDSKLPKLKNFILPGGGFSSSHFHLARSICRRVERLFSELVVKDERFVFITEERISYYKYINRLSDFLFVAARYACYFEKNTEVIHKKNIKVDFDAIIEFDKD